MTATIILAVMKLLLVRESFPVWSDAVNEVPRVGDKDVTSGVGRNELSDGDRGVAGRSGRNRFKDITKWKCQTRKRLRNSGQSYVSRNGVSNFRYGH